jgi:hydrogenase maturation protease
MPRTLIIGYGNVDRADDGIAFHVLNALRHRLGQPPLDEDSLGLEALGTGHDSLFVTQLAPELMDTAAHYEQVIFVDAHVRDDVPALHCAPVAPEYTASPFTHHMTPGTFLALLKLLYDRAPLGHIVSIRGHDFDFHRVLSAAAESLAGPAVEHILQLVADG